MSANNSIFVKSNLNLTISEVEMIHDTHYMIRFNESFYLQLYLCPEHNCCEKFGINFMYKNKPVFLNSLPLVGKKINKIIFNYNNNNESNKYEYDELNEKIILLETSIGNIIVTLYNNHNGYYSHDFEINLHTLKEKYNLSGKL